MPELCIVSREYPMLFGYLVLRYGRQGAQDVDVIMDRRHAGAGGRDAGLSRLDRRAHPEIEEALRERGYALVTPGRKGGRRQVGPAEPPEVAALKGGGPSDFIDDDDDGRPVRTPRAIIAAATVGGIVLGLFIIMAASEDMVGSAARAAVAVIEWVRGDAATRTTASGTTTTSKAAPADTAMRPLAAPETRTAPLTGAATRSPEPAVAVPSPTLPPPTAPRVPTPLPAASAPSPTEATPAPRVSVSPTVTPAPAARATPRPAEEPSRPAARPAEEPSRDAASAARASAPSWSGLPKVELSSQPSGSGAKRTLAYTVKLSDTEGRPLSGADVWLRVAIPDRPDQETKLFPAESPGIYRGRLTVGTRTPEISRVRVGVGGTRVEVPVQLR
jgi:hypothetical protein